MRMATKIKRERKDTREKTMKREEDTISIDAHKRGKGSDERVTERARRQDNGARARSDESVL